MDAEFKLPMKVFFSCEEGGFSVVDGAAVRDMFDLTNIQPIFRLHVGPNNVLEQRPLKVANHDGDLVSIECEGGAIVHLNFAEFNARVERSDGEYLYMGGLDEGNDGKGFLAPK